MNTFKAFIAYNMVFLHKTHVKSEITEVPGMAVRLGKVFSKLSPINKASIFMISLIE